MSKIFEFSVPGVKCAACASPIENAVLTSKKLKAKDILIEEADVDTLDKVATIRLKNKKKLRDEEVRALIKEEIEEVGFETIPLEEDEDDNPVQTSVRPHVFKGILGLLTGALLLGLFASGLALPFIALCCIGGASALLTLYLGKESFHAAGVGLIKRKPPTMDTLFAVSTIAVIVVSIISLFIPWLPMMFDAALLIFGFRHIGKAVEEHSKDTLNQRLSFRSQLPPEIEKKESNGNLKKTKLSDLLPGDIILVRKGQTLPVDGECLDEDASIINTLITGKTLPQSVKKGERLPAGCKVPDNREFILLRVKATEKESYLIHLDRRLRRSRRANEKAPLVNLAKKILTYFIPIVIGLALLSAFAFAFIFSPLSALQCFIGLLLAACPCALGLIIPLFIKIALVKAAADGVRFKSGKSLQTASAIDTVVFDLNGTLTQGCPQVGSFKKGVPATNIPKNLLGYLAALEQQNSHPFAKAIRAYLARSRGKAADDLPLNVSKVNSSHHSGLSAEIEGKHFSVGNESFMLAQGFSKLDLEKMAIQNHEAEHVIYFAQGKKLVGCILLSDSLREDAKSTIAELKRSGKKIHLCTGADEATAKKYAKLLEIPEAQVKANCSGSCKVSYIQNLRAKGAKVSMVGDAANDAAALSASHFGIAVESHDSDKMTQQEAGAVITNMNNKLSLRPLLTTFAVAKQAIGKIKQNFVLSFSYNLLSVLLIGALVISLGCLLNPAIGAALMVLNAAFILASAYLFKKKPILPANDRQMAEKKKAEKENTQSKIERELEQYRVPEPDQQKLDKAFNDPKMKAQPKPFFAKTKAKDQAPRPLRRRRDDFSFSYRSH